MNMVLNDFRQAPAGIPPWMWYWSIMFTLNLPALFGALYTSYEVLNAYISSTERIRSIDPQAERLSFLQYPGFFTENLPGIALFLGLFTILFPRLRAIYIERRNNLMPSPPIKPLAEIEEFVRLHTPGLEVKVNLKRPGRIWVYPNGYRRATVAVFSGFVMLWKSDREAAEAVLLHEIAHYRRGDALFMGPGSFLENAVKLTLLFYVLFVALPFILIAIDQKIQFIEPLKKMNAMNREISEIGKSVGLETQPAPSYIPQLVVSIFISIWGLLTTTAAFLVKTTASFVLPVACMWAAELNADYFVTNQPRYKAALLRELSKKNGKITW
jgi:Zn-dependent protease with chaperone function